MLTLTPAYPSYRSSTETSLIRKRLHDLQLHCDRAIIIKNHSFIVRPSRSLLQVLLATITLPEPMNRQKHTAANAAHRDFDSDDDWSYAHGETFVRRVLVSPRVLEWLSGHVRCLFLFLADR